MAQQLGLVLVLLIGLLLSTYAYTVELHGERAKQLGKSYKAYCDIGPFSCTRVFSSEFGSVTQLFGLPAVSNAVVGMAFYAAQIVAVVAVRQPALLLLSTGSSVLASLGLAYILMVLLHDVCVVCCSIYVVNFVSAYLSYRWYCAGGNSGKKEKATVASKKRA